MRRLKGDDVMKSAVVRTLCEREKFIFDAFVDL